MPGGGRLSPIDLVDGAGDVTPPAVTNMIRFMQSLGVDGKPDNGITITLQMRNQAGGRGIDFHMGIEEFENHPGEKFHSPASKEFCSGGFRPDVFIQCTGWHSVWRPRPYQSTERESGRYPLA